MGIEVTCLNKIKVTYEKSMVNIILNREKQKAFVLRSGTRDVCPFSLLLFNIVQEVLAIAIRPKEGVKGIQIGKEEDKTVIICR